METLGKVILVLAIIWPIWQIFSLRKKVIKGSVIIPPFITALFVFIIFVLIVTIFGLSPFHFLWLFPLSFVIGFVLIAFPLVQIITMSFLSILARSGNYKDD